MSSDVNSQEILNKIFFTKYKPLDLIGEGSFGKCFKGINMQNNEEVCFKIEKKSNQKSFLKIESHALEELKGGKGIPDFYLFGFSENFNILIIELLDKTIEDVFGKNNRSFSIRTTAIIAIQLVRKNYFLYNILVKSYRIYT
jgi:predicted Ser/Thr protein kinase